VARVVGAEQSVDRVPAFGGDSQPADDPGSRLPRAPATSASRATTGIRRAVSAVTGILTIVIVWVLSALHKPDILSAVSCTPKREWAVRRWPERPERRELRSRRLSA
jgi:hypothetical protein